MAVNSTVDGCLAGDGADAVAIALKTAAATFRTCR